MRVFAAESRFETPRLLLHALDFESRMKESRRVVGVNIEAKCDGTPKGGITTLIRCSDHLRELDRIVWDGALAPAVAHQLDVRAALFQAHHDDVLVG
jgi:hypothetical protein